MNRIDDVLEVGDLRQRLALAGYNGIVFNGLNKRHPLVQGRVSFDNLASNIRVHCSDAKEIKRATSTVTLDARVSLIILLEGTLSFTVGNDTHRIKAGENSPAVFINFFVQGELFTRHLDEDQYVKKVNVSLPTSMLLSRTNSDHERHRLSQFLTSKSTLVELVSCPEWQDLANTLLAIQGKGDFEHTILREQIALRILALGVSCLMSIETETISHKRQSQTSSVDVLAQKTRTLIDNSEAPIHLQTLAVRLNASPSTIQRHFKKHYGTTLSDYQRLRRLELARKAIVVDRQSIGEAAWIAGYQHVGNFITAFKKVFNISPARLRQQHDQLTQ